MEELPPAYEAPDLYGLTDLEMVGLSFQDHHLRHIDEELPGYSETNLPIYEEPPSNPSTVTYTIRQSSRKLRAIIPSPECSNHPAYLMVGRSGLRLLSKRPDFTLTRIADASRTLSLDSATSSASANIKKKIVDEVVHLEITSNSSFPWMPRGRITHLKPASPLTSSTFALEAANFADFHVSLFGRKYVWKLSDHPSTSLILVERGSRFSGDRIVARFSYSAWGTDAVKGQEVGTLEVFEIPTDSSDEEGEGMDEAWWIEVVIAGMELVVQHWKSMGKSFKNTTRPSRTSLYGVEARATAPVGTGRFGAYGF